MNTSFTHFLAALAEPFPADAVEFKPGATNKEKTKALALAYVDSRSYIERLNAVVGSQWSDEYHVTQVNDRVVVLCHLTIDGVMRTGDGECLLSTSFGDDERVEANAVTSASAQSFKRACVKFGLGAYLYNLPQVWCDYDAVKRKIINPPALPEWALPDADRQLARERAAMQRESRFNAMPSAVDASSSNEGTVEDPAQVVITFGRNQGKTLATLWNEGKAGQGWIRWCANEDEGDKGFLPRDDAGRYMQNMAKAFLSLQPELAV